MATRHTSTAEGLVLHAARIAEAEGFAALSVRRLATEVGASRQVVYTHFGGMDGLLDALHMHSSDLLAHDVAALTAPRGTDESLVAGAHTYVRGARSRPVMFDLTFARPVPDYTPSSAAVAHSRTIFVDHIVGLVRAWLENSTGDHDIARAVKLARIYWSSIHGLVIIERAGHATQDETDELVEATVRLLLDGWRSRSTQD